MPRCQPIPSVDIRGGRCVRLKKGDFLDETQFGDDPVAVARGWAALGAERIHIIDLDGARDGVRTNAGVIARILTGVDVPVQVGGGVRSLETARRLLSQGADRVVAGTALVQDPNEVTRWVDVLGAERLIVAVDARAGMIATHGWQHTTAVEVVEYCRGLARQGVERVLYTDVDRDGMLSGPNVEGTRRVAEVITVLASGGVSSVEHLKQLGAAGAEGAIIGTALYTGQLDLREALALAC